MFLRNNLNKVSEPIINTKIPKEKSVGKYNIERYKSVKNKIFSARQIEMCQGEINAMSFVLDKIELWISENIVGAKKLSRSW